MSKQENDEKKAIWCNVRDTTHRTGKKRETVEMLFSLSHLLASKIVSRILFHQKIHSSSTYVIVVYQIGRFPQIIFVAQETSTVNIILKIQDQNTITSN